MYYLCSVFEAQKIIVLLLILTKMKKLFLSFAVIATMGLVSCGGAKTEEAAVEEAPATEAVEAVEETVAVVADSCNAACDSVCADAAAPAAEEVK